MSELNDDLITSLLAAEALRRLNATGTVPESAPGPSPTMEADTRAVWAASEARLNERGCGAILAPFSPRGCDACAAAHINCSQTVQVSFYPKNVGLTTEGLWLSDSTSHRNHWEKVSTVELAANQHVLVALERSAGILSVKQSLQAAALSAGQRVAAKTSATRPQDGSGGVSWGKI